MNPARPQIGTRSASVWVARLVLLLLGLWPVVDLPAAPGLAGARPNVVFVLTDDQGYGDMSCHGHPVLRTPHIDRLHAEGARFTDFHVSPTCSPTRAALMAGRHEFRSGVTHTILERERLAPGTVTLAEVLRGAGYATGIFGKWHLGDEPEYQPDRRGFDEVFIHGAGGIGQTYPGSCGDVPGNRYFDPVILHNGTFERTRGYCTDVFFRQALAWMDSVPTNRPFLAWIACNAPHAPLEARPEDVARYAGSVTNALAARFLGMVANIDDNVGRLLAHLESTGRDRDTLVVFLNDNGADGGLLAGYDAGLRGRKGTAFLGGTRAASFWRWPGRIRPGDRPGLTAHVDVLPTLMELAGAASTPVLGRQVEGRSLVPFLDDPEAAWADRTLVTHLGRWAYRASPETARYRQAAVRAGRWHLVSAAGGEHPRWMLFDVARDPGERRDLAEVEPEVVRDLASRFDAWWESVQPGLVNERVELPAMNPFKARYWRQFGGGPSEADLRDMDLLQNPATRPR